MSERKPHCCEIGCGSDATLELFFGPGFEGYTHSCETHKDTLVDPSDLVSVTPIGGT